MSIFSKDLTSLEGGVATASASSMSGLVQCIATIEMNVAYT